MIKVSVEKKKDGIVAFSCKGHAGYAEEGQDIICSAVSALTINAVNSVEKLAGLRYESKDCSGNLTFRLLDAPSPESNLLLQSMIIGLQSIEADCPKYLKVTIVES